MKSASIAGKLCSVLLLTAALAGCGQLSAAGRGHLSNDRALFEELKKLQGRWESSDADRDGKPDAVAIYRLTSGGTALEETLFPGMPQEMVTLYNQDRGSLTVTHYCMLGNQPRLAATAESTPKKVVFHLVGGMNMDPRSDEYMGSLVLSMPDKDHLRQEWTSFKGTQSESTKVFEYTRQAPIGLRRAAGAEE